MRSSALLIEAINDEPYVHMDKRYGFSTKYADCFACGTPFLVYAPEAILETRFAKENDCAFVAISKAELPFAIKKALFDIDARTEQVAAAKRVTDKYFDRETNTKNVANFLADIINEAGVCNR